jgi:predicted amidohydrolase YtcJ
VLLRGVELVGHDLPVEVLVAEGVVVDVGMGLRPGGEVEVVDGHGGALLPGLHDHHVHVLAMAARAAGLDLDTLATPAVVDVALRAAASDRETVRPGAAGTTRHRTVSTDAEPVRFRVAGTTGERTDSVGVGWVRASGYDEARHGPMDRHRLDALAPGVPLRVQHRSGLGWVLSTTGLMAVGALDDDGRPAPGVPGGVEVDAAGRATGWLLRMDAWLGDRVPSSALDLAVTGACLAGAGVTGVTDATFALGRDRAGVLRVAVEAGDLPQRLVLLGVEPDEVTGPWARVGPAKLLADEALGLDPGALAASIAAHHAAGRPVAIHAVTRAENVAAVAALAEAGTLPGDRIEHGSVLPHDLDPFLAAHGVTVVVQPSLVAERGDHHLAEVDADDVPLLHRHASLLAAGVRVGVGSDAPVTSADPWAGIAAASTRRTRSGADVGSLAEAVPAAVALDWYLADPLDPGGPPRRVEVGAPADLCLLDRPLHAALAGPSAEHVRSTWVGGRLVRP